MNGKVFTIRLANHNTKVSNFDNHEESGGFVVTHNEYNKIRDKNKDKSDIASKINMRNEEMVDKIMMQWISKQLII